MQTLGLASEEKPTDGMLKRLFWPTIENQHDVDLVGVQGFWVCSFVALLSLISAAVTHHTVYGLFVFAVYLLAGMGVRERSVAAAVLILSCFVLDRVLTSMMMVMPGFGSSSPVVGLAVLALLAANVRGTLLARQWERQAAAAGFAPDPADMPERTTSTLGDRLSNVLPARVWPAGRFIFYPLAGLLLLLTAIGIVMVPVLKRYEARQALQEQQDSIQTTVPAQ